MALTSGMLGGGTFTGRAIYDTDGTNSVFGGIAEDVSPVISMVSPYETPFLSILGDAEFPANNVIHEWLEDELAPNTIVTTTNATSTDTILGISGGLASYLQVGAILRHPVTEEYMQIEAISASNITVLRNFGATLGAGVSFNAASASLTVISDAAQEGADVLDDISRPRRRLQNQCQIFKKDVIVSGTMRAVNQLGGVVDEMDYQKQMRTREAVRDLEKAIILSVKNDTIGSATVTRTMKGLLQFVSTNSLSTSLIDNANMTRITKAAWDEGGSDLDILLCGQNVKTKIDLLNEASSTVRTTQGDSEYRRVITEYEGTYGRQTVVLSRWMPANKGILLSRNRIKAVPLKGRSFAYVAAAKTGDAEKGMILGEYSLEVRNEAAMAQFTFTG